MYRGKVSHFSPQPKFSLPSLEGVVIYGMKIHATCHISDKKGAIVDQKKIGMIFLFCEEYLTCMPDNFTILQ